MNAPATPHLSLGLDHDAERLHRRLHHEVTQLLDLGVRLPCHEQPGLFHSDRAAERRQAARMCGTWACMALTLCGSCADAAGERLGVRGGKDRQRRGKAVA